ncbi:MAG: ankyrin repeat domain-containing protein [Nitrospirae bacterium]|nr:ankyrin repeat domain-containing protein [Nitrospirota bacterium]
MRFLALGFMCAFLLTGCALSLINAASDGETKQVLEMLDKGQDVNARSPVTRSTPLILAAWNNHIETVRALLDRGADVNAQDATGWTALHAAAFAGNTEIMKLLLERGAVKRDSEWTSYRPSRWADKEDHLIILELMKQGE